MLPRRSENRSTRRTAIVGVALVSAVAMLAACSSTAKSVSPTSKPAASTAPVKAAPCHPPADGPVKATPVSGTPSDYTVTSFDGTQIRVHWFPVPQTSTASRPEGEPTVLMGPGWGSGGSTDTTTAGTQGNVSIKDLHDAGYNVLTWDPRGFGKSTGTIEIDSAAAEGRDVERIIDWVAKQPGVELDATDDPRVGMVGASYGGGIQLTTAAIDCRVDAIVPSWAWSSLTTSLDKAATPKSGWSTLLYAAAAGRKLDPHIVSANASATATATIDAADLAWFAQRGPGSLVKQIHAPTLFVQGTVDTLFTLDEAVANYTILRGDGVPTAMIWYCSGHGVCLTPPGDRQRVAQKTLLWLARYLKRDTGVDTGPGFELVDQKGTSYSADHYPLAAGAPITGDGHGTLTLSATDGSGPAHPAADNPDLLAHIVGPITPAKATNAVNVEIPTGSAASVVVGAPQLRLTYTGTVQVRAAMRPTRVFAQLVDPTSGVVLGNQITPIEVTLDGRQHTTTVPLEMVAYTTAPGGTILLQIVATTVAYAVPRLGGSITIAAHLTLPVAADLTAK
jgi:ABC-2 type transport system ATP-binding protein